MNKKFLFFTLCGLSSFFSGKAQFFIGGGAAFNSYNSGVGLFPALQPRLGVDYKEGRASIMIGYNFSPFTQGNKFNAVYQNAEKTESTSVFYTEKLSINNAFLHVAYRLGNMENAFRFKFIGGASNDFIKLKYSTDKKIPTGMKTEYSVDDANVSGPKVDIGVGADYRTSQNGDLNFELIMGLPANQVNGQYIYNPTVSHIGLTITYSHFFGKREYTGEW